jgi:transcription elongation factor Elf1
MIESNETRGTWCYRRFTCPNCRHVKEVMLKLDGYQDVMGIPNNTVLEKLAHI